MFDQSDYSVVVKHKEHPPNTWRWEIYRAGRASPIKRSPVYFHTMVTANRAGKEALEKLLDKLMPDRLKRPAQLGKLMIDIPSGEVEDREPEPSLQGKDPAAVSLGRRGGLKGSKAKMTPERRSEIARKAAKTRWKK